MEIPGNSSSHVDSLNSRCGWQSMDQVESSLVPTNRGFGFLNHANLVDSNDLYYCGISHQFDHCTCFEMLQGQVNLMNLLCLMIYSITTYVWSNGWWFIQSWISHKSSGTIWPFYSLLMVNHWPWIVNNYGSLLMVNHWPSLLTYKWLTITNYYCLVNILCNG